MPAGNSDTSSLDEVMLYPDSNVYLGTPDAPRQGFNGRKVALFLGDLVAVAAALLVSVLVHRWNNQTDPTSDRTYFFLLYATLPVWSIAFTNQSLYRARFITRGVDEGGRILKAIVVSMVTIAVVGIMFNVELARTWIIIGFLVTTLFVGIERIVARFLFRRARRNGAMLRRVLIIGRNQEADMVREMLDNDPSLGYEVVGYAQDIIDEAYGEGHHVDVLADTQHVVRAVRSTNSVGVIVAATAIDVGTSNRLIRTLTENGIHVELSSTLCDIAAERLTIRPLGRFPMVYIEPVQRHGWRAFAKRSFDLATGSFIALCAMPILALAMLAIRLDSPGPVFFKQQRVGRDGKLFDVFKLRSMVTDAEDQLDNVRHLNEANGPLFKIKDDPRITRVGRFIRKTSIDELPQLFNVIRGEMSLVGPRPALPSEVDEWEPSLFNRLRVQPGITGMWQVNGRSDADVGDYGQLDLYYVDNWTLYTDLSILVRTIPAVLLQRGAI